MFPTQLKTSNSPKNANLVWKSQGVANSWWTTKLVPNLKLHYPMVLVIISLLGLLCMLHSLLSSSNQLLYSKNKLSMSLNLNPCTNYNIYGVYCLFAQKQAQLERILLTWQFIANSAYSTKVYHWHPSRLPLDSKQCRVCFKVLWVLSIWLFIWGW